MTTTAKLLFTLGTSIVLLLSAYLFFGLLPKLTAAPQLRGVHEIAYVDRSKGELVAKEIHGERGFVAANTSWQRPLSNLEESRASNVAGATTRQVITNPCGTYTATIEENALSIKWKYSPFRHKIASGVAYSNLHWLDDYYFLVEGGQIFLMDVTGKIHQTIPGQMYDLFPK